MQAEHPHSALTDSAYWNAYWQRAAPPRRVSVLHPYYGRYGAFLRLVATHVGPLAGARVLEVGAGGPNYRLLALHKWGKAEVTAVDYSEVGLQILQQLFWLNDARVTVVRGDMLQLAHDHAEFDLVVHWGVLEHFADPLPLLRACRSVLSPDGRVLFSMPNMHAWAAWGWKRWSPQNWARHVLHCDDSVQQACLAAGLDLERTFHFGGPTVLATEPEATHIFLTCLRHLQRWTSRAATVFPLPPGKGISMERGFVARAAAPQTRA